MKKIAVVIASILLCLAALPLGAHATPAALPEGFTAIWDRAGLEAVAQNPGSSYALMANIDMGDGPWRPIPFEGVFDGNGFALYNLAIREPDPEPAVSVDGNAKEYDTLYAALFSRCYGATIKNLTLLGVDVDIATEGNAYAAGLVGYAEDTAITNCSVAGSVKLAMGGLMCGVGGLAGFGWGTVTGCAADVTLVLVDENQGQKCEQFLGGALASGYMDIADSTITVRGFASVYGYVHNGGIVGMYYVHTSNKGHSGYVTGNTVDAVIDFFEANNNRRAYCSPVIGEQMHWILDLGNNTVANFVNGETMDTSVTLLPEPCAAPAYSDVVTEPGCYSFGYTTHTCTGCGTSYVGSYIAPTHQPGDWVVAQAPTAQRQGLRQAHCTQCGELLENETLVGATGCTLDQTGLELEPEAAIQLFATVTPADAWEPTVSYSSSDEAVALVNENGLVTAVAPGTAVITCTPAGGGTAASCTVTVRAAPGPLLPLALAAVAAALVLAAVLLALALRRRRRRARREARHVHRRR